MYLGLLNNKWHKAWLKDLYGENVVSFDSCVRNFWFVSRDLKEHHF